MSFRAACQYPTIVLWGTDARYIQEFQVLSPPKVHDQHDHQKSPDSVLKPGFFVPLSISRSPNDLPKVGSLMYIIPVLTEQSKNYANFSKWTCSVLVDNSINRPSPNANCPFFNLIVFSLGINE